MKTLATILIAAAMLTLAGCGNGGGSGHAAAPITSLDSLAGSYSAHQTGGPRSPGSAVDGVTIATGNVVTLSRVDGTSDTVALSSNGDDTFSGSDATGTITLNVASESITLTVAADSKGQARYDLAPGSAG
jgi:hypothetical protein